MRNFELTVAREMMLAQVLDKLEGTSPKGRHYDTVLGSNAKVFRTDGSLLMVLIRDAVRPAAWKVAYQAVKRASRSDPMFGRKIAAGGQENFRSGTIGFMTNGLTGAARSNVRGWSNIQRLALALDSEFRKHLRQYQLHGEAVCRVPQERLIPGTLFTTVTCNYHDTEAGSRARMAYHRDGGNIDGAFGVMSVAGKFSGGLLIFPRYRLAVNIRPLDVLIADNTELHGNTPIFGTRLSVVCYAHSSNLLT